MVLSGAVAILSSVAIAGDGVDIRYEDVRPEHRARVLAEACSLPASLRSKDQYTSASPLKVWTATVRETDPTVVPYDQARCCIELLRRDGLRRNLELVGFRTIRLEWVNDRLLYVFTDVGHVAGVGQLLDVDEMKWIYARTEYYD